MSGEDREMAEMHRWLEKVRERLDLPPAALEGTTGPLLDLIRDVAHGPSRPAAPLTAFLVGLAAGRAGAADGSATSGASEEVARRIDAVLELLDDEPTA